MNAGEVFVLCIIIAVFAVAAMAQWIADHSALGEHMFDWMMRIFLGLIIFSAGALFGVVLIVLVESVK